jgi:hypothetical protein
VKSRPKTKENINIKGGALDYWGQEEVGGGKTRGGYDQRILYDLEKVIMNPCKNCNIVFLTVFYAL